MKSKSLIVIASVFAVVICLIVTALLFYKVTPSFLIISAFTIGVITGICIAALIQNLVNIIRTRRVKNKK